jgi:hypothetical protein
VEQVSNRVIGALALLLEVERGRLEIVGSGAGADCLEGREGFVVSHEFARSLYHA